MEDEEMYSLWEDEFDLKLERFIEKDLDSLLRTAALAFDPRNAFVDDISTSAWDAACAQVKHFFTWHGYVMD